MSLYSVVINTEKVLKVQRWVLRVLACPDLQAEVTYTFTMYWGYTPMEALSYPREQKLGSWKRMKQ